MDACHKVSMRLYSVCKCKKCHENSYWTNMKFGFENYMRTLYWLKSKSQTSVGSFLSSKTIFMQCRLWKFLVVVASHALKDVLR